MKPYESLGKWISVIYRQGKIHISNELKPYNIGYGQFPFLNVLFEKDGIRQEDISRMLSIDKATTGRAIKKLEVEGYVKRVRDTEDRRAYKIFLTPRGRKMEPVLHKILLQWTNFLDADFSDEEKEKIRQLLGRMYQNALEVKYKRNS
jgi:DNA-binding MarR family transcriptional regulator